MGYSCKQCINREWAKTEEGIKRQNEMCVYCQERMAEGHSCMAGHRITSFLIVEKGKENGQTTM